MRESVVAVAQKCVCPIARAGWYETATHQRGPTTAPRGQFELPCVQSGPIPGSSDNLAPPGSPVGSMLTRGLVRTPARHGLARPVVPARQQSTTPAPR